MLHVPVEALTNALAIVLVRVVGGLALSTALALVLVCATVLVCAFPPAFALGSAALALVLALALRLGHVLGLALALALAIVSVLVPAAGGLARALPSCTPMAARLIWWRRHRRRNDWTCQLLRDGMLLLCQVVFKQEFTGLVFANAADDRHGQFVHADRRTHPMLDNVPLSPRRFASPSGAPAKGAHDQRFHGC